jgi:electron transfer flavoprotein alpha/beta subunit
LYHIVSAIVISDTFEHHVWGCAVQTGQEKPDLWIVGKQAIDDDSNQTGIAAALKIVTAVTALC